MSGFAYRDGIMHAEGVALDRLAAEVGTPAYVYAASGIRTAYRELETALAHRAPSICYAVKANSNLAVIRLLAGLGAGADTVSGGEIERALAAGVPPARIVYAGVGKSDAELRAALAVGVGQINVESREELERLAAAARAAGVSARVALRVNPDVAAGGHDKISTGRQGDKFGVPLDEARATLAFAAALDGIEPVGLHLHIGSQIGDLAPFEAAYRRGVGLLLAARETVPGLRRLDLGGGLGVRYRDEPRVAACDYAAMLDRVLGDVDVELILEPGRWLVAEAGILLASVIQAKRAGGRRFLILDAGMNNLIRPAMYGAWHEVLPVVAPAPDAAVAPVDLVGPICESSDVLARDRPLPPLAHGSVVAIGGAGAYGAVMASDYNTRASAPEILIDGDRWAVIKPRREPADQFADERIPDWLMPIGEVGWRMR